MEIVYCNELIYLTIVEWQNDRFITSLITCNHPISWLSAKLFKLIPKKMPILLILNRHVFFYIYLLLKFTVNNVIIVKTNLTVLHHQARVTSIDVRYQGRVTSIDGSYQGWVTSIDVSYQGPVTSIDVSYQARVTSIDVSYQGRSYRKTL
jgi:ABC-type cobalt transport system substrate-binding protein